MTDQLAYELLVGEQFLEDLRRTAEEADHNPGSKADFLRRQIFGEMSDLMSGHRTGITSSDTRRARAIFATASPPNCSPIHNTRQITG
jgi:hypothetical protein